jgi:hypothetical protein
MQGFKVSNLPENNGIKSIHSDTPNAPNSISYSDPYFRYTRYIYTTKF